MALATAFFVGLFALDVFSAGYEPWQTVLALLIHLVPAFGMLVATALAWRWPWMGSIAFIGWAVWYQVASWGRFPASVFALMSGVPFLIGILFLLSWRSSRERWR